MITVDTIRTENNMFIRKGDSLCNIPLSGLGGVKDDLNVQLISRDSLYRYLY